MNRLQKPRQGAAKSAANGTRKHTAPASRILLVEDHASLGALRCAVLRRQGYAVVLTADGLEACRLLEDEAFDLVVTDAKLPSGSGWEVARAAKKIRLPVILSTGWPLPPRVRDADYVLSKPSSISHLLALIHLALKKTEAKLPEATR